MKNAREIGYREITRKPINTKKCTLLNGHRVKGDRSFSSTRGIYTLFVLTS